jgi:peptidoglycan/LPS O-acetylase OafA/YrhL
MAIEGVTERYHALDALRAGALLLGVFTHATISFFPDPAWIADDTQVAPALMVANFAAHIFRMSLFFAIAGFFAHMLLQKRGVTGFVGNRLTRIALPFLVFWPIILASFIGLGLWSAAYADAGLFAADPSQAAEPADAAAAPSPAAPAQLAATIWGALPLTHLWFLYALLWLYAAALALAGFLHLIDPKDRLGGALDAAILVLAKTHALPFVLAAPHAAVFFLHEPWTTSGGIRTPDFGLIPNLSAMVGYGTAFGFGWLLHRQTALLDHWRRWWPLYGAAAAALTVVTARMMGAAAVDPSSLPSGAGARLVTAALYPLAIWAWCLALIGAAIAFLSRENRVIRYLSDSSYWIYIVHLPVVIALQVLVSPWPWAWQAKLPLILAVAIPVLLASYQLLVRASPLGGWLNGRRYGGKVAADPAGATLPQDTQ